MSGNFEVKKKMIRTLLEAKTEFANSLFAIMDERQGMVLKDVWVPINLAREIVSSMNITSKNPNSITLEDSPIPMDAKYADIPDFIGKALTSFVKKSLMSDYPVFTSASDLEALAEV